MRIQTALFPSLLSCALLVVSCGRRAAQLPIYDSLPNFTVRDSLGGTFDRQQMNGTVWVVDFIYTNCPAECPMMSARMRRLVGDLGGDRDVRFLSISVDPARDTPKAMKSFADRYGGASEKWKFVTGSPDTVHLLAYQTFHVGDVLGKIEHSTKFMVVDRQGRIRGYYSSTNAEDLASLKKDVHSIESSSL